MYDKSKIASIAKRELGESDLLAVQWELATGSVHRAITLMAARLASQANDYPVSYTATWQQLAGEVSAGQKSQAPA